MKKDLIGLQIPFAIFGTIIGTYFCFLIFPIFNILVTNAGTSEEIAAAVLGVILFIPFFLISVPFQATFGITNLCLAIRTIRNRRRKVFGIIFLVISIIMVAMLAAQIIGFGYVIIHNKTSEAILNIIRVL